MHNSEILVSKIMGLISVSIILRLNMKGWFAELYAIKQVLHKRIEIYRSNLVII